MFREIIQAFRRQDVVHELTEQIGQMLDLGKWMFETASETMIKDVDWNGVSEDLYARDRQINQYEQAVRERIVTHLGVGNQADVVPCLMLMSVVKDAERIGDYCKNIFEVGKFFSGSYEHGEFSAPLREIRKEIIALFEPTKQAFLSQSSGQGQDIRQKAHDLGQQCEVLIRQLLNLTGDFSAQEAVAYVLLARHYKRVSGHLSNIASGVVSSLPLLDFND